MADQRPVPRSAIRQRKAWARAHGMEPRTIGSLDDQHRALDLAGVPRFVGGAGSTTSKEAGPGELDLVVELHKQWALNHSQRCELEWPHSGDCLWPQPVVLQQVLQAITGGLPG